MVRDKYGRIEFNNNDIIKILYQNPDIDTKLLPLSKTELSKYLQSCKLCNVDSKFQPLTEINLTVEDFDKICQNDWFITNEYTEFDIKSWLLEQCQTDEEYQRILLEIEEFEKFKMMFILNLSKFLVDTFRKNQIVWGVGRGSSVASYCLYLIGLHKINSIKYNLDINEFLK
jgi:DNA polymerase III alpha subunit